MTRRIAVFTGTRAEYGLLYWVMRELQACGWCELQLIAGAMHFSPEFGETWRQIERDGFPIDAKVEMLLSSNTQVGVAKSIGLGTIGFADALDRLRPDCLMVLGDRFEALAVAQAALIMHVPLVHMHGGEITEGAYDDAIRHAVTKMASLHFVSTETYRRRVIQLGESPGTVFNVGALGLDHMARSPRLTLAQLSQSLAFELRRPYFLVTYHPATVGNENPATTFAALLEALDQFPDHQVVITYPNADSGGRLIISLLEDYAKQHSGRVLAIKSLGSERYISVAANAAAIIGNSSSGIIEVPALAVPTIDIGIRQQGRLAAGSVLHCEADRVSILAALREALSPDFAARLQNIENPYGNGDAAIKITKILKDFEFVFPKKFYDLV